jgi:hypothetical protein
MICIANHPKKIGSGHGGRTRRVGGTVFNRWHVAAGPGASFNWAIECTQSVEPEILWAPGRVTVRLGGDSYEAATDDTLQSLEEALITAGYAFQQALQEYE